MKKLLVLLTVAVGIFAFGTGAVAQGLLDVCTPCFKCDPQIVGCPDQQGGTCPPFDYNTDPECEAVFAICNCLDAGTVFVAGKRFGIRLTILVDGLPGDNGVYWAGPNPTTINFAEYATQSAACGSTGYPSNFGPIAFWKADSTGHKTSEVTTLQSGVDCEVASSARATIIESVLDDPTAGYTITTAEELAKLSYWVIDIPPMRIDSSLVSPDQKVQVKIEIIDMTSGGICADCLCVCECIIEVAVICPTHTSSATCLYPYFTSPTAPTETQPWWNGIAITNTGSSSCRATLTITQKDGTSTYETPVLAPGEIFVRALQQISPDFVGTVIPDEPLWISLSSTCTSIDGFAIIADTDTGESMGYLCRKSSCD